MLATLYREMCGYVGIPTALDDIQLLLDQLSKAQFQWILYEDRKIRAVILDEVLLVNYATVEMHQTYRVLRQFRFRHPILVASEELIIVLELAYASDYMPWFRIHGKSYLLSEE
ncbi:hypothetical protein Goshw_012904 [Gossypium schwendimanii]|uniref:Uncharacterized protein n=1 Tax=Gossypium schwendimanii TaxID=34291 RepID=A0A7J9L9M4_GOSSC|nr:hypothetical protein [Gossypium schwendimanii]